MIVIITSQLETKTRLVISGNVSPMSLSTASGHSNFDPNAPNETRTYLYSHAFSLTKLMTVTFSLP